jgi:hypothetical protein
MKTLTQLPQRSRPAAPFAKLPKWFETALNSCPPAGERSAFLDFSYRQKLNRPYERGRHFHTAQIRRYIGRIEPAVSGQLGHRQTFFVARALVHGFALSKEAALPFLQEYNQRCEPPWSEEELEHKLDSADNWQPTNAQKPRGYLL